MLDVVALRRFVDAYQEVSPLTIAELWALPTMLRACVLQRLLVRFLDELHVPVRDASSCALHAGAGGDAASRSIPGSVSSGRFARCACST